MRPFCILLLITAAVFQAAGRSSSETRILPDGTSEHHVVVSHQSLRGALRLDQHTRLELLHAALRLDIGVVRAAYGPMRGTEALQRAAAPTVTVLRSLAGSNAALPDIDLRRTTTADPQYFLGVDGMQGASGIAGFASVASTAFSPTADNPVVPPVVTGGFKVRQGAWSFSSVLRREPVQLPNMLNQPYYLEHSVPGSGDGFVNHAMLKHSWGRGVNMAGLHVAFLPALQAQTGGWLYHRLRYGNTRLELRAARDPAGYKLHSMRFDKTQASLTATVTRFNNGSVFSMTGYVDTREETGHLRMTTSLPLGVPGAFLLFGSQMKADGNAQLSPGLRWERRQGESLLRAGLGFRLESPSLRNRRNLHILYSRKRFKLEYDVAWDSYMPGAEQELRAVLRLEHARLGLTVRWNSLVPGSSSEGIVQGFAPTEEHPPASLR